MHSPLPTSPIRVLLVDDHHMVREGLRVLLAPFSYVQVVGSVATAADALPAARTTHPHVVLLDLHLPDGNGLEVCQLLLAEQPALRVVVLTTLKERGYLLRLMQAGAAGYMLKNALPEELAEALVKVQAGKTFFSEEIKALLIEPAAPAALLLTRREKEVLGFIAEGLTSQEMAGRLSISNLTIETHRRNLLLKFGANNTATLIRLAVQQGFV